VFTIGETLPPIRGDSFQGGQASFAPRGKPLLIYFFSPSCTWCERNLDNIKTLIHGTVATHDFVAIATNTYGLEEYVRRRNLDWPLIREPTAETRRAYQIGVTPVTLVIGPDAKVKHSWIGAFAGEVGRDISSTFQVSLPGLRPVPAE
jgi:hypothetical protein